MATTNDGQLEGRERVSGADVQRAVQDLAAPVRRDPNPLTRIGFTLALLVFGYMSVVTLILLGAYYFNGPSLPSDSLLDEAQLNKYQQLSQSAFDQTMKLLDALVLKGFLPVFTAVLGYIFGTYVVSREET